MAQNFRSWSSFRNIGIFFMFRIDLPFLAAHVPGRNHPNQATADGKEYKQPPARIGPAQGVEARLLLRVFRVVGHHQRAIEKDLFTLRRQDLVLPPDLVGVVPVPVKPFALREEIEALRHDYQYICTIYRRQARRRNSG